jgi:hypothetical protein
MHREHSSNPNAPLHTYTFGALSLTFKGLGVPILSDKARERINALTYDQAKEANQSAWKQSRECARLINRHNNFSVSGNMTIYDHASQRYHVAEEVKRLTWRRMCELTGR